jgi:pyruvate dehydrogenase E1 component beta subunit
MCGVGAEVAAIVADQAFDALKAPVVRITGPDAPAPSSYMLEQAFMPQPDAIVTAALKLAGKNATQIAQQEAVTA